MKLNAARVDQTLNQFEAQAIPGNHPVVPQLNRLFGEHTFFLNGNGLHVVEVTESDGGQPKPVAAQVVKLASWKDDNHTSLTPHEPELLDVVVMLASDESKRDENERGENEEEDEDESPHTPPDVH
jgi:hypothetical protein